MTLRIYGHEIDRKDDSIWSCLVNITFLAAFDDALLHLELRKVLWFARFRDVHFPAMTTGRNGIDRINSIFRAKEKGYT